MMKPFTAKRQQPGEEPVSPVPPEIAPIPRKEGPAVIPPETTPLPHPEIEPGKEHPQQEPGEPG